MAIGDELRDDPETIHIEFAGEERPFLLSVFGAKKARDEMGVDFIERLSGLISQLGGAYYDAAHDLAADGQDPGDVEVPWTRLVQEMDLKTEDAEALAAALYAGLVPFEEDLGPKEVQVRLTVGEIKRLLPEIGPQLFSFVTDDDPTPESGEVPEDASGKG